MPDQTLSKTDLTERKRGKGGTLVRLLADGYPFPAGSVYVVKDLMARKTWNKPDRIGIGPLDRGVAFGVALADVALVDDPLAGKDPTPETGMDTHPARLPLTAEQSAAMRQRITYVTQEQDALAVENGECVHAGAELCNAAGEHRFDLFGDVAVWPALDRLERSL